jgi:uncharacterized protein YbjT (DUF2867 family)
MTRGGHKRSILEGGWSIQLPLHTNRELTLVVGGTGKTGRRVVQRLEDRNLPVRIGSCSAAPAFDWQKPATWGPALQNATSMYLTYYPDLAAPGSAEKIRSITDLAVESGVRRMVLLSGRGEKEARRCEQIVQDAGIQWTLVRSSWFCQNFSESFMLEPIRSGEVALPAGDVAEPFIDAEDIADVVVAALTEDGHAGRLYEVTGPRLLTFAQAVEQIAQASGRPIRFVQVSVEEYAAALVELGVPGPFVELVTYLFSEVLDGRNAHLTDGVQRALGRAPRDFNAYARATAATGIWKPQSRFAGPLMGHRDRHPIRVCASRKSRRLCGYRPDRGLYRGRTMLIRVDLGPGCIARQSARCRRTPRHVSLPAFG